jgi:hypothetical protein
MKKNKKMKIFLALILSTIINQLCVQGEITLYLNKRQNKLELIETPQDSNDLYQKNHNKKRGFFEMHSFYGNPYISHAGLLKQIQKAQKKEKKENDMRLEQDRRDKIFRQYLNQQSSFHRDFHTIRY